MVTKLNNIRLSYPIFRYAFRVTHFTPRKPTVFEEILIDLIHNFKSDEEYNKVTLDFIFATILKVNDSDNLVLPSLKQLITLQLIKCEKEIISLKDITIANLTLTDDGKEMYKLGVLPGVETSHKGEIGYDPIKNKILDSKGERYLTKIPQNYKIEDTNYKDAFPADLIQDILFSRGAAYLTAQSKIKNIKKESQKIFWKSVTAEVNIDGKGFVQTKFNNDEFNNFFSIPENKDVMKLLLNDFFEKEYQSSSNGQLELRDFSEISDDISHLFDLTKIHKNINQLRNDTSVKIHFFRFHSQLLTEPIKNRLMVFWEAEEKLSTTSWITWNDKLNGVSIFLNQAFPVKGCWYLNSNKENIFGNRFELNNDDVSIDIPLGYSLKKTSNLIDTTMLINIIECQLEQTDNIEDHLIKLYWLPLKRVWQYILERIKDSENTFERKVYLLESLKNRIIKIENIADTEFIEDDILNLFLENFINSQEDIIESFKGTLNVLNSSLSSSLQHKILQKFLNTVELGRDLNILNSSIDSCLELFEKQKEVIVNSNLYIKYKELKAKHNEAPKTYIIDTCVLVDAPDILNKFSPRDHIILPNKVLDELDGLKKDNNKSVAANKAINNIKNCQNLTFQKSSPSLLSVDYSKSPDNLILSIAMQLRNKKPIILTTDKVLQMKAKNEGIQYISLSDFINTINPGNNQERKL